VLDLFQSLASPDSTFYPLPLLRKYLPKPTRPEDPHLCFHLINFL